MKNTTKPLNSSGSAIALVAIVLVLAAVVGMGWFVYAAKNKSAATKSTTSSSTTTKALYSLKNDYQKAWNEWNIVRQQSLESKGLPTDAFGEIKDSSFKGTLHSTVVKDSNENCTLYEAGSNKLYVNLTKTTDQKTSYFISKDACASKDSASEIVGVADVDGNGKWTKGGKLMGDWSDGQRFHGPAALSIEISSEASDRAIGVTYTEMAFSGVDLLNKDPLDLSHVKFAKSPDDIYKVMKNQDATYSKQIESGTYDKFIKDGWELAAYASTGYGNSRFCLLNEPLGVWVKYTEKNTVLTMGSFGLWDFSAKQKCQE